MLNAPVAMKLATIEQTTPVCVRHAAVARETATAPSIRVTARRRPTFGWSMKRAQANVAGIWGKEMSISLR